MIKGDTEFNRNRRKVSDFILFREEVFNREELFKMDMLWVFRRSLDWTGCCCSGAGAAGNDNFVASTSNRYLESSTGCPDVKGYHAPIHICSLLASMPSSVSLDSGYALTSGFYQLSLNPQKKNA